MDTILIADDDPLLAELVEFKLRAAGFDVVIADDGDTALSTARDRKPAAIVLDSMMPVLSGPEVLHHLKSDPATAGIPVLMLTARRSRDDVIGALEQGATDYLTKPFIPDELVMRLRMMLAARQVLADDAA